MKYQRWDLRRPGAPAARRSLERAGLSPLCAALLCARGLDDPQKAAQFLSCFWRGRLGPLAVPVPLTLLGLTLMAAGDGLFIAAILTMKDSWRAGVDESQRTELVTGGLYRLSRNPAFVGFDLLYLGSALALGNLVLAAAVCAAVVMIHLQILEEEKHLEKMFGQPYLAYRREVGRYL